MYPCSLSLMIALLMGPLRGEPKKKTKWSKKVICMEAQLELAATACFDSVTPQPVKCTQAQLQIDASAPPCLKIKTS